MVHAACGLQSQGLQDIGKLQLRRSYVHASLRFLAQLILRFMLLLGTHLQATHILFTNGLQRDVEFETIDGLLAGPLFYRWKLHETIVIVPFDTASYLSESMFDLWRLIT